MTEAVYARKLAVIDGLLNDATVREMSYEHRAVEFFDENPTSIGKQLDGLSEEGWELVCMELRPMPFCRIAWLRRPRS
jgi:hypothetical protein